MTRRSTRNKLRHQAAKAINDCDRILNHLQMLDDMANGESPYINKHMPDLVALVSHMANVLGRFRDGL